MAKTLAEILRAARKTQHEWIRGQATPQPWFAWQSGSSWQPLEKNPGDSETSPVSKLSVLSWNIDQFRAFENERMTRALTYLEDYVSKLPGSPLIMLNEMLGSDLQIIQRQPWIRKGFYVTDESHTFWESSRYGKSKTSLTSKADHRDQSRVHAIVLDIRKYSANSRIRYMRAHSQVHEH